jgi:hypothetical protein
MMASPPEPGDSIRPFGLHSCANTFWNLEFLSFFCSLFCVSKAAGLLTIYDFGLGTFGEAFSDPGFFFGRLFLFSVNYR